MKCRNFISRVRTFVISALTLACVYQPALAVEAMKDVSKEISDLRSTVTAIDLYTLTTSLTSRITLTEENIVQSGCPYSVTGKNDVDSLLDVFVGAQLAQPTEKLPTLEPRIVAYLHTREGKTISIVLTREFIEDPARGTYNHEMLIVAKMGFGEDLRQWRRAHKPKRWSDLTCSDV